MITVFVVVALAVVTLLGALHSYAWRRLVRDTTAPGSLARRLGSAVFVAGPVLLIATFVGGRGGFPLWFERFLAWPGYMWVALFIYLSLALLAGELVRPLLTRWLARRDAAAPVREARQALTRRPEVRQAPARRPETVPAHGAEAGAVAVSDPEPPHDPPPDPVPEPGAATDPSRRLFVSRVIGGAAAAIAVGTVGTGTYGVLRGPGVKRVTVPLAKLPRAAHGFRIAVVSDIHLGPILGRGFAQRVVDTINATGPDLIAVVGDMVDGDVADLASAVAPLAGLRARHGTYFVTGNHEYFSGAGQWIEHVRELGMRPLANARTELPGFDLAGVNDVRGESEGQGPDFTKALGGRDRSRTAVLLAHQPVVIDESVRYGVDLQLSGHTHGGQLWPGPLIAGLVNPTLAGLERYGDTQLYVTRGAGTWGPPVRVGAPSDITVVQLASKQA